MFKSKKTESIAEILFGLLWFGMASLVLVLYSTNSLSSGIPVPKIFMLFYDILGIIPGSIVQMCISSILIGHGIYSLVRKKKL